ncbi:MAG: hypothetical protein U1E58_07310 [Tabrizicola sp.]
MKAIKLLFSLIVLISTCYLIYLFSWLSWNWVSGVFAKAGDTVIATSITAIVTVVTFLFGKYLESSRERRERLNIEKIRVYKKFVESYFSVFNHEKIHGKKKPDKELLLELLDFQQELVFWGSDGVLRAYLAFRNFSTDSLSSPLDVNTPDGQARMAEMFRLVSALIAAMRRDLGYTFTSFGARDLATLQLQKDDQAKSVFSRL